ncbi:MAG: HAMP domain-containing histidine kinase, partial [Epsilonproteobacteria bacterium]|nr:HAMP domain-containing histidine kinase [Campylobacterota bacterium]
TLIHDINVSVGSYDQIKNFSRLTQIIYDFNSWNENILKTTINLANDDDKLTVFASSDKNLTNKSSQQYTRNGVEYNTICYKGNHTYYIPYIEEKPPILVILSPINRSGTTIGTYEITISMEKTQQYLAKTYDEKVKNIVLLSTIILFVLIFSFLFLLRKVIVKPITTFRDTAKIIGKGKLDTKINISSRDELGELADAFNQMTKDLKESRDKIQDYTQILENLLDRKDEFIGQLGHDLKNPLQPLIGLLPVLIEKEKDPETKEALQIMNKNAEYMRDLIFETLQLAKLRSADVKFDFEDVKLREEAEGCVDSQKLLLKEHKITVDNKIADNITVYADKLRLVEVFKNLISNAVKYMQEGGGKITLDAKQEGDIVTVSIQDTGIGMTQEQLKKMFDEFYKADRFSSEYQSTGLGLAICKRIIEKHDGKIWVDSPGLGKGTTFYFTLKNKTKNN